MQKERVALATNSQGGEPSGVDPPSLEQYQIERELGHGGQAVVYLATDARHNRKVALKVLRPELAAGMRAERFLREIATLSSLTHPNILPLLDSGRVGETLYFTMPYVQGESLRQLLGREGQLPVRDAIRIAREVAEALDHAHRHGVIHRDIKPENILIADGRPLVADFGIARALGQSRLTYSGLAIGSPMYMSPEQVAAEPSTDARSDVYSLGCVLYELLTGMPPFHGKTAEQVCAQHLGAPVPSMRIVRPLVSRALERVVCTALAKLPADRFRTSGEFANALQIAGEGLSTGKWWGGAFWSSLRARPWVTALATLVMLGGGLWAINHEGASSVTMPRRVAVTPFANRTGLAEVDPIGLMMADWITTGLQRVRALEVVPTPIAAQAFRFARSSSVSTSSARDPISVVAAETGAQLVISGAVYRNADRLIFRIEVTDARRGRMLVALEDIEAAADDPIPGVEEARARIMGWFAGQYDERISSEMAEGARPPIYQAYVAFSEGIDQYVSNDFAQALPNFLRAYAMDSSFTAALLYGSLCHTNLGQFAQAESLLSIMESRRSLLSDYERAWLDYRLAFLAGNHAAALSAIRRAANLAPDSKAAYNHAVTAFQSGRADEALTVLTAIPAERGPMRGFLPYWNLLGAVYHTLARYKVESEVGERERNLYPDRLFAYLPTLRSLAANGQTEEIDRTLNRMMSLPTDPLGLTYGEILRETAEELRAHGYVEAARRMFERTYSWYSSPQLYVDPGTLRMDVRRTGDTRSVNRRMLARTAYALAKYTVLDSLLTLLRAENQGDAELLALDGLLAARRGQHVAAAAVAESLSTIEERYQFGAITLHRARIAAALGDRRGAAALLRQAFTEGAPHHLWLHRDLDLASVQSSPNSAQ